VTVCTLCSGRLGKRNKSGYCASCWPKVAWKKIREIPGIEERRLKGVRERYMRNPELKERAAAQCRWMSNLPQTIETRSRKAREQRLWEIGTAACPKGCEARQRAGRRVTETRLAWCPRELRAEYRRLVTSNRLPAAVAREMILDQHEKDMREFRRSIGG
jgi:hypothetical protein